MKTRNEIWGVIKKHLENTLEEFKDAEIDTKKSMVNLGVNSLDIIEIVSCSTRELKIKVPRAELNKVENLDGLIDLMHRVANESPQ